MTQDIGYTDRTRAMSYRLLLLMPRQFLDETLPIMNALLHNVEMIPLSATGDQQRITRRLRQCDFLVFSGTTITGDILSACPRLRLIQKWGAGVDGIDIVAARRLQIPVANVPGGNAVAVSEHAFGLVLMLYKRLNNLSTRMRSGEWPQSELLQLGIGELYGSRLGLIGFGSIARQIASRALAFGMEVTYHKPTRLPDLEETALRVSFMSLPDLIRSSDVVVLALPLTEQTRGLVDYRLLSQMKSDAILINVSRGAIIIEAELCKALRSNTIAAAGLDVFETEPLAEDSELRRLTNVVLSPHIAGRSRAAMRYISTKCAENVLAVARGEIPQGLITGADC